jgi:hypothetical protein
MIKACPHCGVDIEELRWEAEYIGYGKAWGTRDQGGNEEWDDDEINDSETDNKVYQCPECYEELEGDFFNEPDEEDDEEEEVIHPDSEGTDFEAINSKFFNNSKEIDPDFRAFMCNNCNLSEHESDADEDELKELYPNDYRDFCQLNN